MFDRVVRFPDTINVQGSVHEHRAPTDDSVRLYAEMVDKAESRVVGSFVSGENIVKGCVVQFNHLSRTTWVGFNLNGKELRFAIDADPTLVLSPHSAVGFLHAALSKEIASLLLADVSGAPHA